MHLKDGYGSTRERSADVIEQQLDEAIRKRKDGGKISVKRYVFAGRTAKDTATGNTIKTSESRPFLAQEYVSGRTPNGAVLTVTDACAVSAMGTGFARSQAENRGVRFYALACCNPDISDIAVLDLQLDELNPIRVQASVRATGSLVGALGMIHLQIDGNVVDSQQLELQENQLISFTIPAQATGWHLLALGVEEHPDEVVHLNNLRQKLFQATTQKTVLLCCGRPSSETVHLARILKNGTAFEVETVHRESLTTLTPDPGLISLLIIGNVPYRDVPESVRSLVRNKIVPVLFLGEADWEGWAKEGLPRLSEHPQIMDASVNLHVDKRLGPEDTDVLKDCLPVTRLLIPQSGIGPFQTIGSVPFQNSVLPAILVDTLDRPMTMLCLIDTTWRWRINPDAKTRIGYEIFWSNIIKKINGIVYTNEKLPVFHENMPSEYGEPVPVPDLIQELATDPPTGAGLLQNRDKVIETMLDELPSIPMTKIRKRSFKYEVIFGLAAALLLAVEWWLERRARRG